MQISSAIAIKNPNHSKRGGSSLSQENQRFSGSRKFHFPGLKLGGNRSKLRGIKPNLSNKIRTYNYKSSVLNGFI